MDNFGKFGFDKTRYVLENFKDILNNKSKDVSIDEIQNKIFVGKPYFAFDRILHFEDVLIAPISAEQSIEFEITPMSSAEAGRHLAILGSCILAINENEAKYYLAKKALKKTIKISNSLCDKSKKLYVIAVAQSDGKIDCSSNTALVNEDGEIIFEMNILYQKLSKKLFNRVFKEHLRPTNKVDISPYKNSYKYLQNVVEEGNKIKAELPEINDEECAGHFEGAPMLPVGVMSYIITNSVGRLLKKIDNTTEDNYYLVSADLELFEPTNLKKKEFVEIEYNGKSNGIHYISWIVKNELGYIRNTMQLYFANK